MVNVRDVVTHPTGVLGGIMMEQKAQKSFMLRNDYSSETNDSNYISFLLDSGAAISVLALEDFEKLGLDHSIIKRDITPVKAANGEKLDILGTVELTLSIGKITAKHSLSFSTPSSRPKNGDRP